jgi:NAD(P)-dependent dehydrogenase (short-subunit alcohol dehydrogenase family)
LLALEGCDVCLAARSQPQLDAAAQLVRDETGRHVDVEATDLGRRGAAAALAERFGDIDILVNNAGDIPAGNLEAVGEEAWRDGWDVKVFGYIDLTRACMRRMRARAAGGAVVVNVIGIAGETLDPEYIAGGVGNAALIAFTRALGSTSMDYGVRVVGVSPGPVQTDRVTRMLKRRAITQLGDESRWAELLSRYPLGRAATIDEVAAMVALLASPLSSYTSGAVINVDGGLSVR